MHWERVSGATFPTCIKHLLLSLLLFNTNNDFYTYIESGQLLSTVKHKALMFVTRSSPLISNLDWKQNLLDAGL